ncbi:hypothetical protein NHX12_002324 [Muraenolepis orangiensis]|uniref:Zinc finger protein 609 n=1 Tax=Muraenolepis orangiensis TaxID=630683 RepID=A0A9Q0DWL1_9TELE|nr:hypothetical protein NHX12_002324 [Muraenolepis orangiensis]
MSLSSADTGGNGVDSSAVEAYDSGDEWDIGVGNLIIDLDADLEKEKLEMSGSKDAGMAPPSGPGAPPPGSGPPPPGSGAPLPDKVTFVAPGAQSKTKSKRSKTPKEGGKTPPAAEAPKREVLGRGPPGEAPSPGPNAPLKGPEKGIKITRGGPPAKKDKEGACGKTKKEKMEAVPSGAGPGDKEAGTPSLSLGGPHPGLFEGQNTDSVAPAEHQGSNTLDLMEGRLPVTMATEEEEEEEEAADPGEYHGLQLGSGDQVRPGPGKTRTWEDLHAWGFRAKEN